MKSTPELIADFLAPYDDDLTVMYIGDNLDKEQITLFTSALNKSRRFFPECINPINFHTFSSSDLFRAKAESILNTQNVIVFMDETMSNNVIYYLTNNLDDDLEGMLIDKHILHQPQEKYIFDIITLNDDALAKLCQNMDNRPGEYNYLICENYLSIWVLYQDEFTYIFQ